MEYEIQISRDALKSLKSLPIPQRRKIADKIDFLKVNPFPTKAQKLQNQENIWRIRSVNYRIAYTVRKNKLLILILYVGHRKDFYEILKRKFGN